jgi:HK97 family phage major capsid protein
VADLKTLEEHKARQGEIRAALKELDTEFAGETLPDDKRSEWNALNEELDGLEVKVTELEARALRLEQLSGETRNVEEAVGQIHTRRPGVATGNDIYDLSTLRSADANTLRQELRDRSLRSVEKASFGTAGLGSRALSDAQCKSEIEKLVDREYESERVGFDVESSVSRRILITGSPTYKRAMAKYVAGRQYACTPDETRALSVGTGSAGGFAVVYTLDPTMIPTSNYSVNPFRAIARNVQITGTNEWKALTSGAITAAYAAEATQSSDNAPTLAQPDLIVDKAQAFVPFSIELGQDWDQLQEAMAMDLSDAKDDLEATKFAVGAGHGSNEPKGIITGATNTTTAGGAAAFAIADLYKVFEAVPPRFRPRAQWASNLFIIDKIRQFDTAGGSGVWVDGFNSADPVRGLGVAADAAGAGVVTAPLVPKLLGRNFWESTAMSSALTTGQKILVVGDWRYFVIVDRVGMSVEFIQNLVGANQRPTGQRGLYAYWRNQSDVLSAAAFQVLVTG